MLAVILVQFFWLSFFLIGLGVTITLKKPVFKTLSNKIKTIFLPQHPIAFFVIFTLTGFMIFIPAILLSFIFEVPVVYVTVFYLVVLSSSIYAILKDKKLILEAIRKPFHQNKFKISLPILLIMVVLLFDYILSLKSGASLLSDTPIHLAKIQLFLNKYYTFADPYLGYNGIIDTRYSINLIGSVQAVGAQLLRIPAHTIWTLSFAFFRLLSWLVLFMISWAFLGKTKYKRWPYIVLITAPLYLNNYFFSFILIPHSLSIIWISIVILGLKALLETGKSYLLWLGVLLLASTHSATSIILAGFLVLLSAVLVFIKQFERRKLTQISLAVVVCILPFIPSLFLPSRSLEADANPLIGASVHSKTIESVKAGPLIIPKLPSKILGQSELDPDVLISWTTILLSIFFLIAIYIIKKIRLKKAQKALLLLVGVGVMQSLNIFVMSLIGYFVIFQQSRTKATKVLVIALVSFFILTARNPLILTIVFQKIPLWLLARAEIVNILSFIAPIFGVLAVYVIIVNYVGLPEWRNEYKILIILPIILLLPSNIHLLHSSKANNFNQIRRQENEQDKLQLLSKKEYIFRDKVIFSNDNNLTSQLGIVTKGKNFGTLYNLSSNQSQNLGIRTKCAEILKEKLDYSDLVSAKIDFVVVNINLSKDFAEKASHVEHLQLIDSVDDIEIYRVIIKDENFLVNSDRCTIPFGQ